MAVRPEEIASIIRQQIEGFDTGVIATDVGTVVAIDVATQAVKAIIEVGRGSAGIGTRAWQP